MIHQVRLPEITHKRLRAIVVLQMRLLLYAASTMNPEKDGCKNYLKKFKEYDGRSSDIVDWVWRAGSRREPFIKFARGAGTEEKQSLSVRLCHDAMLLLKLFSSNKPSKYLNDSLEPLKARKNSWQYYGAEFLRQFYIELTEATLPYYLCSDSKSDNFTRQEFLKAFLAANDHLHVCAICDDSSYYTISSTNVRSEIEHYFPKSIYPHLACHPYNLIPICHLCNAFVHRNVDPLGKKDGTRRRLCDIFLPYSNELGLGIRTYAKIELGKGGALARFSELLPRDSSDLRERILAFKDVYDIPGRWNGRKGADRIGEALFRRIRQFLQSQPIPANDNVPLVLLKVLDQLLYFLSEERSDQGKDPLAFPMTWWLATLINEEIEPGELHSSAVMKEVVDWLGLDIDANIARAEAARNLRNIAKGQNLSASP